MLVHDDHNIISYRCTFIPDRLVNILRGSLLIWSLANITLCPIIHISCKLVFTLIHLDNISCRFDFRLSRLVNILGGILKIWSRVNLILCPLVNICFVCYLCTVCIIVLFNYTCFNMPVFVFTDL